MEADFFIMQEMDELARKLNEASQAYYGGKDEIMSNFEWDSMFDRLSALENETGYIPQNSPTRTVSFSDTEISSDGVKEPHEFPALSLAKTKSIDELKKWAGDRPVWLSWKLDGLTLVITYDNGTVTRILTRGDGTVGTNITYMKDAIRGIPSKIQSKGHMVVRGEATISYTDFDNINDGLDDDEEKYANPRNLASGTLSLDAKNLDIVKERNLTFNAFTLVYIEDSILSWGDRMNLLKKEGFITVESELTNAEKLPETVEKWTRKVEQGQMDIPVDGLVITYDDTEYASTGSVTGHHATRAGFAFKWQDESAFTVLDHIEWSCAASVITPIAVFSPVQLEGTTVSRASLCNISELERLGIGENGKTELEIIKANKIIPKCIAVKSREGHYTIPSVCPVCDAKTVIKESESGTRTLRCTNEKCPAKNLKKFERFVGKKAMDIDGLSRETIRDFINEHIISNYADIYHISEHEEIKDMEGYGVKSYSNLVDAIEKSRDVSAEKLINALCIPQIGTDMAKRMLRPLGWDEFIRRAKDKTGFADIEGIGPERSDSVVNWFAVKENSDLLDKLLLELRLRDTAPSEKAEGSCKNLIFVITGDVHTFKNRDDFKAYVDSQGGKVTGSVTSKTNFLVNNDITSTSSKNQKAAQLGIPVITEDEFIEKFGIY